MTDHTPVRKKGKARALRANQVHPGHKCTQCTLCKENSNFYVHSVNWRPSEVSLLHQLAPDVAGTDCICRACGEDVKRSFQSSEYTPRWVKKRQCTTVLKVCAIQDCMTNTNSVKVTTIGTIEELEKLLNCDVTKTLMMAYLCAQSTTTNSTGTLTWLLLVLVVGYCLGEGKSFFVTPPIQY